MSLRARFALALGLLATAAVVAFAVTGYVSTSDRLHAEVDRSLRSYGTPLGDPDGRSAEAVCNGFEGPSSTEEEPHGPTLAGALVQCVTAQGRRVGAGSDPRLPIDRSDERLAASGGAPRLRTATVDGTPYRILSVPTARGGAVQLARSLTETDRVLSSLRDRYILVGVAVVLGAALAGWFIARRTARPLVRLTRAAEHIAATGRLEADVPTTGEDETGRLARAFVTMLDALTRSREQQQRLAQDAGHELRTPLTSLRTNIDTLRRHRDLPDATRARVLDDLDLESQELNALVDELVALVTDQPDDEPDRSVELDQLARRAVDRARRRTGRTITIDAEPTMVIGHSRQLMRAIANLLDNAVKFTPDGTTIEVRVADGRVAVRDHGAGIGLGDLGHVFDRFYRADSARSLPGSGLGLAIVQHIAEEHGGTATAENAAGGGAVVTLHLPRAPGPPSGSDGVASRSREEEITG